MNIEIERLFLSKFVCPDRQERILGMLEKSKKRAKFRKYLPHIPIFSERWLYDIPKQEQHAENIYQILKKKGAPKLCYMISSSSYFDGVEMPLKEALREIVGQLVGGTIIICKPEELGYFEGEEYHDRYIICDERNKLDRRNSF